MSSRELPEATFDDLYWAVIEPGYCYACGGCSTICPVFVIEFKEEHPKFKGSWPALIGACIDCGACLQACPSYWDRVHGENDDKTFIGTFHKTDDNQPTMYLAYAAEDTIRLAGQSGGVVTAILTAARQTGKVEAGTVLTKEDGHAKVKPIAAKETTAFIQAAGSIFTSFPSVEGLLKLRSLWDSQGQTVFVGVPCMIKSINWMQKVRTDWLDANCTTIGLLCTTIFHPERLRDFLIKYGIDLDHDVHRIAVRSGVLRATLKDGLSREMPVREADQAAAREGCLYCLDLCAETADLAVGELGVPDGTSFVFVRTQRGRDLLETAVSAGAVILQALPEGTMKHVLRVNRYKKKRTPPPPLKPFPGPIWLPLRKELIQEERE